MKHSIIILLIALEYHNQAMHSASRSYYGNRETVGIFHCTYDKMTAILKRNNITYEQFAAWRDSRYTWE